MSVISEMLVALGVNTAPLSAGLAKANAELDGFAAKTEATSKRTSSSFNAVGMASLAIAGGVTVIGIEAVKSAEKFQSSMTLIQTQAGASAAEVQNMTGAVLKLAPAVGMGPEQLAAGLYHIESAGLRGAQALDILKVAAEGAAVGHADLESVTNALIAAQQSGVGGITDMTQAMGVLNAIVGSGNMRMQDLTDAMGTGVLSTAKNYGVTIQSVGAALASMTDQGIPAIDAATRLNSAMRLMAAPTSKAISELKSIGLSSTQLANDMRSPGGMLTAIQDLKTHLEKSGKSAVEQAALIAAAFGGKQSGAILTLIGNTDLLATKMKDVTGGAGTFGAAWDTTANTAAVQGARISAAIDAMSTGLGLALLPAVDQLLAVLVPLISGFAAWMANNSSLAAGILATVGGLAAFTALVAFAGPIVGALGLALGLLLSPIVLIGVAIAGLLIYTGTLGDAFALLNEIIGDTVGTVKDIISAFSTGDWGSVADDVSEALYRIVPMIANLGNKILSAIPGILAKLQAAAFALANALIAWIVASEPGLVRNLLAWAKAMFDWLLNTGVPMAATALGNFVDAFAAWVPTAIPPLLTALGDLLAQVLVWLEAELPVLGAKLGEWGAAFVAWIGPRIGPLLEALGGLLASLVSWIIKTGLPTLAARMGDVGVAMVAGVMDFLVGSKGKGGLLQQISDWFLNTLLPALPGLAVQVAKGFAAMAVTIGKGFADGFIGLIDGAMNAMIDMINSVKFPSQHISLGPLSFDTPGWGGLGIGHISLPSFLYGGTVPGQLGSPQLILAHGGERITPANQVTNNRPITVNVYNPTAEPASTSTSRELLKLAVAGYLGS